MFVRTWSGLVDRWGSGMKHSKVNSRRRHVLRVVTTPADVVLTPHSYQIELAESPADAQHSGRLGVPAEGYVVNHAVRPSSLEVV